MSDTNHTPEPWHIGTYGNSIYSVEGGIPVAKTIIEGDAHRIVACVNACAGIPTEHLEGVASGNPVAAWRKSAEKNVALTKQRDDLLAALERIKAEFERLKEKAPSMRDAVYLDGILTVINTKSESAIASVKESK